MNRLRNTVWQRMLARCLLTATISCVLALPALANTPQQVIEESISLLDEKLTGKKEELAADREQLYALIDSILLPPIPKNT